MGGLATEAWKIRLYCRGPEFLAQEGLGLANGNALFGLLRVPFGSDEGVGSTLSRGLCEGRLQRGVGGDEESGDIGGGCGSSDLGVADAEQGLLVAEVLLDLPTPDVGLEERLDVEGWIRTKQVGGLAVVDIGAGREAVCQGPDDDEREVAPAGGRPANGPDHLDLEVVKAAGRKGLDRGPAYGWIFTDVLGRGEGRPVEAGTTTSMRCAIDRRSKELGVLANSSDHGGIWGNVGEKRAVGVPAVDADDHPTIRSDQVDLGSEFSKSLDGPLWKSAFLSLDLVLLVLLRFRVLRGFDGSRAMPQIDWNGTRPGGPRSLGP